MSRCYQFPCLQSRIIFKGIMCIITVSPGIKLPGNLFLNQYFRPCFPCVEWFFLPENLLALWQELILNSEKPHPTPTWPSAFSRPEEKHVGSLLLRTYRLLTPPCTHICEARDIVGFGFSLTCVSWEWGRLFLDFVA